MAIEVNHLNVYSRAVLCGTISGYTAIEPPLDPVNLMNLITNRGRMQGFVILDYLPRAMGTISELMAWVAAGDIVYQVDLQAGFKNIPSTSQRPYTDQNTGKKLLKLDTEP